MDNTPPPRTIVEAIMTLQSLEALYGNVELPEGTQLALNAFEGFLEDNYGES